MTIVTAGGNRAAAFFPGNRVDYPGSRGNRRQDVPQQWWPYIGAK